METIERLWDKPTIFDEKFENGIKVENTIGGIGTIIVDKEFIDEMLLIAEKLKEDKNLVSLAAKLHNEIKNYFTSQEVNDKSRQRTYEQYEVVEDGYIVGTKISSLKGKNVAQCSEKSIAAYIILEKLYSMGNITRKPLFVISELSSEVSKPGPHAFVILNKDCDNPTKHVIFDPENPTLIEDKDGQKQYCAGLYSLTDEEYNNLLNGLSCSPTSLYDFIDGYHEVGEKRTYGRVEQTKKL